MKLELVEDKNIQEDNHIRSTEWLYNLATGYYEDVSKPDNEYKAFNFYREASNMGYAPAQNSLGLLYETGYGTDYDPKKAAYWYEKAISQNSDAAMVNLARLKIQGDIEKDYKGAKVLLERALQMNNLNASELLMYIEENKPWNFKQKIATTLIILSIIPWTMFAMSFTLPILAAMGLEHVRIGLIIIIGIAPALLLLNFVHTGLGD